MSRPTPLDDLAKANWLTALPDGPVGVILCDSAADCASTATRLIEQDSAAILLVGEDPPDIDLNVPVHRVTASVRPGHAARTLNHLIDLMSGRWLLWLWNGEYFFFPFGTSRSLADLTTFLAEERRPAIYTYALDLYAPDMFEDDRTPQDRALYFDREGYHAFGGGDRPLKLYGGLGWRFEEIIGADLQQIGRASLFRAERGVHMGRDMVFETLDYASVSCPWHHNPTAAVMSLRRSRRLLAHKRFPEIRDKLIWSGSERFDWTDHQLLRLGMIEPGQWF